MARQSILLLSDQPGWSQRVLTWPDFDAHHCASAEEARALLTGSRPWAVLLIDGAHHAADRDLIALATTSGSRPVVVESRNIAIDWGGLGAHSILGADFDQADLMSTLSNPSATVAATSAECPLVCVTGSGGTGASTVAIALSQGLASRPSRVLLADFRRHAELHVLHHLDPHGPGIGDLVEAHRTSSPDAMTLAELPAAVPRGYRVLTGLRRAVGWSSLRPRALAAALRGLRSAYDIVVCDVDPDLEGEAEGGSCDVEERNSLSRTAVTNAACVVVVGGPGAKGAHSLLRVLGELWAHGVDPRQTVAVVNRGDRVSIQRLGTALAQLGGQDTTKLVLPELDLEPLLFAGAPLPEALVSTVTDAVLSMLSVEPRSGTPNLGAPKPERITPGSLGTGPH